MAHLPLRRGRERASAFKAPMQAPLEAWSEKRTPMACLWDLARQQDRARRILLKVWRRSSTIRRIDATTAAHRRHAHLQTTNTVPPDCQSRGTIHARSQRNPLSLPLKLRSAGPCKASISDQGPTVGPARGRGMAELTGMVRRARWSRSWI